MHLCLYARFKLIEKGVAKALTLKSQAILYKLTGIKTQPDVLTKKAHSILDKHLNKGAQNINSLIDGSGLQNATTIQALVQKLIGSGLKMV